MATFRAMHGARLLQKLSQFSSCDLANVAAKRAVDQRCTLPCFEMFKRSFRGSNRDVKRGERKAANLLKRQVKDPEMEFDSKAFIFQNYTKEILAFQKRLDIVFNNESYLKAALVNPSFLERIRNTDSSSADLPSFVSPDSPLLEEYRNIDISPQRLGLLGLAHTQRIIASSLFSCYPQLPGYLLDQFAIVLSGRATIAKLATHLGIPELILIDHDIDDIDNEKHLAFSGDDVVCDAFYALMGAIYHDQGIEKVTKFVNDFIITYIDDETFRESIKIRNPVKMSTEVAALAGFETKPEPRLIFSAGRNTELPLYVVGIFSGESQIGEGASYTLKKAETAAFENSIFSAMWRKETQEAVL